MPLRRRTELKGLSEEHHNALVVALRCRRTAEGLLDSTPEDVWPGVLEFFALQIDPHFDIEERLLMPALVELGEQAMAERMADEHERLRGFVAMTRITRRDLAAFASLLDAHIRFEEREVFEQTQDRLPQAVLDDIARASERTPRICPTTFRVLDS
jgi:hemerythrin-like domain-containing protein